MTSIDSQQPAEISESELVGLLTDDAYALSQKHDGQRVIISTSPLRAYSKHGEQRDIPAKLVKQLEEISLAITFDGELIGNNYYVFDLLSIPQGDIRDMSWSVRQRLLDQIAPALPDLVQPVTQCESGLDKVKLFQQCADQGAEGVIFARKDSSYRPGKRSRNLLKYKFVKQVDCVVIGKGIDGKDNLELAVYNNGVLQSVGKVSALQGDGPKIQVNDVVTVTCLYSTNDMRLFHANKPKLRFDKPATECTIDQLEVIQKQKVVIKIGTDS